MLDDATDRRRRHRCLTACGARPTCHRIPRRPARRAAPRSSAMATIQVPGVTAIDAEAIIRGARAARSHSPAAASCHGSAANTRTTPISRHPPARFRPAPARGPARDAPARARGPGREPPGRGGRHGRRSRRRDRGIAAATCRTCRRSKSCPARPPLARRSRPPLCASDPRAGRRSPAPTPRTDRPPDRHGLSSAGARSTPSARPILRSRARGPDRRPDPAGRHVQTHDRR